MVSKLFTKKNIKIIYLLKEKNLHLRAIAEELKISPAKVHSALKLFQKYHLTKTQKHKNF